MLLRKNVNPRTIILFGMAALAIANVSKYVTHRNGRPSTDLTDAVEGFLFGIAIATLLLGVWMNARRKASK